MKIYPSSGFLSHAQQRSLQLASIECDHPDNLALARRLVSNVEEDDVDLLFESLHSGRSNILRYLWDHPREARLKILNAHFPSGRVYDLDAKIAALLFCYSDENETSERLVRTLMKATLAPY